LNHILAIAGRELRSFLTTPIAYVLFTAYMLVFGYVFNLSLVSFLQRLELIQAYGDLEALQRANMNDEVIAPALSIVSIILLFLMPLLTVRTFAEERGNGTIEMLLTSPLATWEIVLGKYLALLGILGMLMFFTALYPGLLFVFGDPDPELLQTLGGMLSLFLLGAGLGAMGLFISTLTRSVVVAAMSGILAGLLLLLIDLAAQQLSGPVADVFRYIGFREHFEQGLVGLIRTQDLVYFGVSIVLFLSLGRISIESLRWR
jgi:ABC-2 type transport system permease protein